MAIFHTHLTLANLAINAGDTSPNPGAGRDGSIAYSTILGEPLYWANGSWQKPQGNTIFSKINGESISLLSGTPVYTNNFGVLKKAMANDISTLRANGLVLNPHANAGDPTIVLMNGVLSTDVGSWQLVTGNAGGLVAGATYYLDPTAPGRMTVTPPPLNMTGLWILVMGVALNATDFQVAIKNPYQL